MTPWFIATERFSPADSEKWRGYIAWCGLTQLEEVVSLDRVLRPTVLDDVKDDDGAHTVNGDFMLNFFVDHAFLLKQIERIERKNVLCVFRNPESDPSAPFPWFMSPDTTLSTPMRP